MNTILPKEEARPLLRKIEADILNPVRRHKGLTPWIWLLVLVIVTAGFGYVVQLQKGLGVTAMRDYVSWGIYIANFVFFVAVSLVGMLISAVLGLLKQKWVTPISRISEIVALSAAMVAGIVIVLDMGRPDRLHHVFLYGRFQSPILWDVTVITTYVAISLLLYILPLIPDITTCRKRLTDIPKWQQQFYKIISLGWFGLPEQYRLIHKSIRILLVLIIPVALAIHTVTSWLFAATLRPGWDTTIFGPYFVTGAFVTGVAAVIIAMYFYRNNFKLKDYITEMHFDKMSKLLVLVSLVYLYFNINEFLVPGYKMPKHEGAHLYELFVGKYAIMFWLVQIPGLVLPIILLIFKQMRRPTPAMIISIFVLLGAWFKRYLIVIPTMQHPFLPIQNVPDHFIHYVPTGLEVMVTLLTFALALTIGTILSKLFPVIPIWEVAHERGVDFDVQNQD